MSFLHHVTALTLLASVWSTVGAQILLPAVHWDHDKADLQHLVPVNSHNLYHSPNGVADPTLEHAFANLTTTLAHPAIILDHSDYIKSVSCQGNNIEIAFADSETYDFAKGAWASEKDFILATYTTGCGVSSDQRSFWLVDHLTSGPCDTCITAVADKELEIEDAIHRVKMVWGTYTPTVTSTRKLKRQGSSNSTESLGNATNGTCGPASSRNIDGFPTAACNSTTFDEDLDNRIGYLNFDAAHYSRSLQRFAPGLEDFSPESYEGFGATNSSNSSSLHRRALDPDIRNLFKPMRRDKTETKAVDQFGNSVKTAKPQKAGKRKGGLFTISPKFSTNVDIGAGPDATRLVDTKSFGPAFPFLQKSLPSRTGVTGQVGVYCVQCGVQGHVRATGEADWNFFTGNLHYANVALEGSISARVALGIEATLDAETQEIKHELHRQGIPKLQIPKFITIGPSIVLSAEAQLTLNISGSVMAGIRMEIPNFSANIDLVNKDKSISTGFEPTYTRIFNASGQVSVTTAFGLPIGLSFGLQIPKLKKFDKSVTITTRPGVELKTTYAASTNGCPVEGNTCVNGISNELNFINLIYANIFDFKVYNLHQFRRSLASSCLHIGPQPQCPAGRSRRRGLPSRSTIENTLQLAERQAQNGTYTQLFPNNITSFPVDTTGYEADFFQAANETALASVANATAVTNGTDFGFPPDTTNFTAIADLSGSDELFADPNGNLYYAPPGNGSLFAVASGIVEGDVAFRFFHYYADTMKAYNVSRLRLSDEEHTPLTASLVALAPLNYDANSKTQDAYVAIDTLGNVFFPVTCDIQDQPSKVFLVADVTTGLQKLLDPSLRNTVTGGRVESCYVLPLAAPPGSSELVTSGGANSTTPTGTSSGTTAAALGASSAAQPAPSASP